MNFGIESTFSKGPGSAFSEGPGSGPLYKACLIMTRQLTSKNKNLSDAFDSYAFILSLFNLMIALSVCLILPISA